VTQILLLVSLICLILGMILLKQANELRKRSGLPAGQIVYVDTGNWKNCERPLFSNRYRLTGRPDYLVRQQNAIIPVEVKSNTGLKSPYSSHIAQLLAYCLLIEETERKAPPFGLLHYPDATYRVPYNPSVRAEFVDTLTQLRGDLESDDVARSHSDPQRCQHCGFRRICSQSL
jgi:CRISPR-associated exonuclease Cas4